MGTPSVYMQMTDSDDPALVRGCILRDQHKFRRTQAERHFLIPELKNRHSRRLLEIRDRARWSAHRESVTGMDPPHQDDVQFENEPSRAAWLDMQHALYPMSVEDMDTCSSTGCCAPMYREIVMFFAILYYHIKKNRFAKYCEHIRRHGWLVEWY
jgi:hypothetical protein